MTSTEPIPNPLVSQHKSSDGLHALLHPLVLLSISDYITRHNLRRLPGPIVGALLGRQNGREISLEHAFDIKLTVEQEDEVRSDRVWFDERLQQFKDVHKSQPVDLVGWFTIAPASGPRPEHLPIHRQILNTYNESAVLLAFHPDLITEGLTAGGKLPLTIYETVEEATSANVGQGPQEGSQQLELERDANSRSLRFREIAFTLETGEAERICVDFVARGGGNAAAIEINQSEQQSVGQATTSGKKGKGKSTEQPSQIESPNPAKDMKELSEQDEELISSLTTRANAVKMLHARIQLIRAYLSNLPPSYLTEDDGDISSNHDNAIMTDPPSNTEINHPVLRSIQALIHRLPILAPTNKDEFHSEMLAEKNDVFLAALLGAVGTSVMGIRETGRKFHAANSTKQAKRNQMPYSVVAAAGLFGPVSADRAMARSQASAISAKAAAAVLAGGDLRYTDTGF
ncbi:MAG: hypothetical protein M1816_007555 [Peltula sp. TS41687]|nr:MAG: hypothetical protein M1816_007555 [Peltula sp. TS41687]